MNEAGIYTWPDGKKYDGLFKNDKKDGHGEFTWENGNVYFGEWENGK